MKAIVRSPPFPHPLEQPLPPGAAWTDGPTEYRWSRYSTRPIAVSTLVTLMIGLVIAALLLRQSIRRVVTLFIARVRVSSSDEMELVWSPSLAGDPATLRFLSRPNEPLPADLIVLLSQRRRYSREF
jgi:hypothetical protein